MGGRDDTTLADGAARPSIELDEVDRGIIRCLRVDGRMSNAAIASDLKVAEATIRRRLRRLYETHTLRVVPVVDPDRIGLDAALFFGIKVRGDARSKVAEQISRLPEVRYVAITTGPYDLLVEAFVGSRTHLARLIVDQLGAITGIVELDTLQVLRVAKFAYEWEVPEPHDA